MIPLQMPMPDLSGVEKLTPTLLLHLVFARGDMELSAETSMNRRVYIRLVDKALDEYQAARDCIVAQLVESQRSPEEMSTHGREIFMLKFVDHMENCISTTRRALRFVDNMQRNPERPAFPRLATKAIDALGRDLIEVRNLLEHLDDEIRADNIRNGTPVMLRLSQSEGSVELGAHSLRFSALSTLIEQLHAVGASMVTWRATDAVQHVGFANRSSRRT